MFGPSLNKTFFLFYPRLSSFINKWQSYLVELWKTTLWNIKTKSNKTRVTSSQRHCPASLRGTEQTVASGIATLSYSVVDAVCTLRWRGTFFVDETPEPVLVGCNVMVVDLAHEVSHAAFFPRCQALEFFDWKRVIIIRKW